MKNLIFTLLLLCSASFSFAQNVPAYVPTNGLVGWWPFNGNANDESGNGNNGVVNGATLTTDRFGLADRAYSFNGTSNFIEVASNSTICPINSLTVSCWAKVNSTSSWNQLVSKRYSNTVSPYNSYIIAEKSGVQFTNDNYAAGLYTTNSSSGNGVYTGNVVDSILWNNFVLVYDSIKLKIYRNGLAVDSMPISGQIIYSNIPLYFGSTGNSGPMLNGKLDDIGIWNRALTPQEITALYNGNICYQTISVTDTLFINTNITGFNPVTYENSIRIWPNPTNDHITIDAGDLNVMNGYSIRISNSLGQQMFQSAINQQQYYLDLSTWTGNGIYFVNIIDPSGNIIDVKKIVLR